MAVKCPVHHGQAVGGWPSFFTSYTLGTLCLTLSPPPPPAFPGGHTASPNTAWPGFTSLTAWVQIPGPSVTSCAALGHCHFSRTLYLFNWDRRMSRGFSWGV